MAKFITTIEAAKANKLTPQYVTQLCREGKIPGAQVFGDRWMVPATFRWKHQKPGPKPKAK